MIITLLFSRMRRLKSLRNDPFSLGCIYLCLLSTAFGYIIKLDPLNDLEETETFNDGRVSHKRTPGREIQEGFGENVNGGVAGGDLGYDDGGSGRYVEFSEAPPKFVEARQHGKVLLECAASGTPAPQIKWYKDGKPLHKVTRISILTTDIMQPKSSVLLLLNGIFVRININSFDFKQEIMSRAEVNYWTT